MLRYSIFVLCKECGGVHRTGFSLTLAEVIRGLQSIAETYNGKPVPPLLRLLIGMPVSCPGTGKSFVQEAKDKVFLSPYTGDNAIAEEFRKESIMEDFPIWFKLIVWGIVGSTALYAIIAILRSIFF